MPDPREVNTSETQGRERKFITGVAGGATTLEVYEQMVYVTAPTGAGTHTVTLPPVSKSMGRFYLVKTPNNDTGTVTVVAEGQANVVLTTTGNRALYYNHDGMTYELLFSVVV